jgi:hypothetical protein
MAVIAASSRGLFDPGDFEVVVEVEFHLLAIDAFEVGAGHHPGREGQGGAVEEFIQEVALSGEDHGQEGFGVGLELGEGVEFQEDFQSQQRGLIDDQGDFLLFSFYRVLDLGLDDPSHDGAGVAFGFHLQGPAELAVEFEDGAAGGGDPKQAPFGGVEVVDGKAKGGGFSRADFAGDHGDGAQAQSIIEAVLDPFESRGRQDLFGSQVGAEGFFGESEERAIGLGIHDFSSLGWKERLPPR